MDLLIDHGYPTKTQYQELGVDIEGFLELEAWDQERWDSHPVHLKVLAIDCEMCGTSQGSELTRVSIVDMHGETVYDTLVLPDHPIRDYKTQYSGITAESLANVTTKLADVHVRLTQLISARTILVGHSLENDLIALKLFHGNCLDTSILYPRDPSGPQRYAKLPLRQLAFKFLHQQIRQDASPGHCSIEDAATAMRLACLKAQHGWYFGLPSPDFIPLFSLLHHKGLRSCMVGFSEAIRRFCQDPSVSAVVCQSDDEIVAAAATQSSQESPNKFVIAQVERFSKLTDAPTPEDLAWLNRAMHQILRSTAEHSVVLVLTAPENLRTLNEMAQLKSAKVPTNSWSAKCENEFQQIFQQSRFGLGFIWTT